MCSAALFRFDLLYLLIIELKAKQLKWIFIGTSGIGNWYASAYGAATAAVTHSVVYSCSLCMCRTNEISSTFDWKCMDNNHNSNVFQCSNTVLARMSDEPPVLLLLLYFSDYKLEWIPKNHLQAHNELFSLFIIIRYR